MSASQRSAKPTSGIERFFVEGLRAVDRRLPLLGPLREPDEKSVVATVESSVIVGRLDRLIARVHGAIETSVAAEGVRRATRAPLGPDRALFLGVALITATVVHVSLVLWHEGPTGWQWLILPGLALATGVLALLSWSGVRREHG